MLLIQMVHLWKTYKAYLHNNMKTETDRIHQISEMPPNLNKILISKSISTEEGTYFLTRTPMGYVVQVVYLYFYQQQQ